MKKLQIENELESLVLNAKNGAVSLSNFLKLFTESEIFVPSASEVLTDGHGLRPMLFEKDGIQMLGCFTRIELINIYNGKFKFCLKLRASDLLKRIPENIGLVVNPGYDIGFDITASRISAIIKDFGGGF